MGPEGGRRGVEYSSFMEVLPIDFICRFYCLSSLLLLNVYDFSFFFTINTLDVNAMYNFNRKKYKHTSNLSLSLERRNCGSLAQISAGEKGADLFISCLVAGIAIPLRKKNEERGGERKNYLTSWRCFQLQQGELNAAVMLMDKVLHA